MTKILMCFAVALAIGATAFWGAGSYLSKPANRPVSMPAMFENVVVKGTYGSFLRANQTKVCALLLHGTRSDRSSMIGRATFLKANGISSLLIDLQAHGETSGTEITLGIKESLDAENGLDFLRLQQGCQKVVAIGQSLGGASALLGGGPLKVDALVLESVYPTIEEAVADRLEIRLGTGGRALAPLLYMQIPFRIGVPLEQLRPIDAVRNVHVPLLVIAGALDEHTKADETIRLFEAANQPKLLWLVEGAAHEDLLSFNREEYQKRIIGFIDAAIESGVN